MPKEVPESLKDSLERFLRSLRKVVEEEGDSVWTWYILNMLGPSQIAERKVNRILANPPWVIASKIQVERRKKEVESLARELGLWVGGRHAPAFDIAALFIVRCGKLYLDSKKSRAAWITNNAAIKGGNWEGFRSVHEENLSKIIDYGELEEEPFTGAKSCALIEDRNHEGKTKRLLLVNSGEPVGRNQNWEEIHDSTYLEDVPDPIQKEESNYVGKFRNGATIFPHCLVVVEKIVDGEGGRVRVETRRSRHSPWKGVRSPEEAVPKKWITPCIFSDDLLPFAVRPETTRAVIPLREDGSFEKTPEKEIYWGKADKLYRENRGRGSRTPETLSGRINYNSAIEAQLRTTEAGSSLCQVVYNGAGQHLRAARCGGSKFVVEHACYWWTAGSEREAQYLVSMLNSGCLQDAYRECRKSDRHFETHIWGGVPVPSYDPEKEEHLKLAELCVEAENFVAGILRDLNMNNKQEKLSRLIKEALWEAGISQRIDQAAAKVLPDQAREVRKNRRLNLMLP